MNVWAFWTKKGYLYPRDVVYGLLLGCQEKKDLEGGMTVYSVMIRNGLDSITVLGDHLIRLFASCGSLSDAKTVFCNVSRPSVHTWTAIISACTEFGEAERALTFYKQMQQTGLKPDRVLFLSILKACSITGALEWGRLIHDQTVRSNFASDVVIGNTLVDMYAKCVSLKEAREVFNRLSERTIVSFGAMITGYATSGHGLPALELFANMHQKGINPSRVTFLSVLKACGSIRALEYGRLIYEQIIKIGLEMDTAIGNNIVDMYAKCGSVQEAQEVFDDLPNRNMASWGAMIAGYIQNGKGVSSLALYEKMQQVGVRPDKGIFYCIMKACSNLGDTWNGRMVHEQITRSELESDTLILNTLLDMYSKCGMLQEARHVFDNIPSPDIVSWGAMIAGYTDHGHAVNALDLFKEMQDKGPKINVVIFSCILKACGSIKAIGQGKLVYDQVVRSGFESDVVIVGALVDMYAKCGSLEEARSVFDKLQNADVVSWGAMLAGYAAHGKAFLALELFEKLQVEGIKANAYIFSCLVNACGIIGAVARGRLIHIEILRSGLDLDDVVGNTLVDMYAKCGNLYEACNMFDGLPDRDISTWGSMVAGFARYGNIKFAVQHLEGMQEQQGLKPSSEVFSSILAACSHAGVLKEGCWYFNSMVEYHGITPSIEHYNCLIGLLGRVGQLNEAADLLKTMAIQPDSILWKSLLTSCRIHGNVELGRHCFDQVVRVDPQGGSGYALMSSIYVDAHMWEDVHTQNSPAEEMCRGMEKGWEGLDGG